MPLSAENKKQKPIINSDLIPKEISLVNLDLKNVENPKEEENKLEKSP